MSTPYNLPQYVIDRVMAKRGRLGVFDRFEPARTALLVIDMQKFYIGQIPAVLGIIPSINRLAAHVRAVGGHVIFIGMTAGEGGRSLWPIYHDYFFTPEKAAAHRDNLTDGVDGHAFHPDLDLRPEDAIVYKSRFSPFIAGASNIEDVLRAKGVDSLVIAGTVTNMCCETTARDAMMRDYKVAIVADATAARDPEDHVAGLASVFQSFCDVRSTQEVVGDLLRPQPVRTAAE